MPDNIDSSIFSSAYQQVERALHKGVEAIQTDRIYFAAPILVSGFTAYRACKHLSTALMGQDSIEYRKKLIDDAFNENNISTLKRSHLLATSFFGSISFSGRLNELGRGLGYLTASTLVMYALHSYTMDTSADTAKADSMAPEAEKEIFPKQHNHDITSSGLKIYGKHKKYIDTGLHSPHTPNLSYPAQQSVKLADQILIDQETPATTLFQQTRSALCSVASPFLNTTKPCYPSPKTTETMNSKEIAAVCHSTKEALIQNHPVDYYEKIAKTSKFVCDWTWGALPGRSQSGDCQGLENNLYNKDSNELSHRLNELDQLCEVVNERSILQGRANYIDSDPDKLTAYTTLYQKLISSANAYSWTIYKSVDRLGEPHRKFLEFSKNFPLSSKETNIETVKNYQNVLNALIPVNSKDFNSENLPIFREAAANFFGISPGFTQGEFNTAYRKFQKSHHADNSAGGDLNEALYGIAGSLKGLFGKSEGYSQITGSSLGQSIYSIPTPYKAIEGIWNSFSDWWSAPLQT